MSRNVDGISGGLCGGGNKFLSLFTAEELEDIARRWEEEHYEHENGHHNEDNDEHGHEERERWADQFQQDGDVYANDSDSEQEQRRPDEVDDHLRYEFGIPVEPGESWADYEDRCANITREGFASHY
jgi:hypothetical protein